MTLAASGQPVAPAPAPVAVEEPPVPQAAPFFATFEEAASACSEDYEEPGLIEFLAARNKGASFDLTVLPTPAILATFDALRRVSKAPGDQIKVLDIGGAFGAHLKWAERHVPYRFKWAVVETPALVARAEPAENLAFFSTIQEADEWLGGADLLLASGVLQYFKQPTAVLEEFTGLKPQIIVISRTIVSLGEPAFEIQRSRLFDNGPGPIPQGFEDREVRMVHVYQAERDILKSMTNHKLIYKLYEGPQRPFNGQVVRDGAIYVFEVK